MMKITHSGVVVLVFLTINLLGQFEVVESNRISHLNRMDVINRFYYSNTNMKHRLLERVIDEYVQTMMECHSTPALSIAVVRDGKVILSKGYGHTRVVNGQKTTSRSRFSIGSLSKGFTGLLAAKILREHKMYTLDTPISKYMKNFRQTDDYRSENANLRDLLSHRMAIPEALLPLVFGFNYSITRNEFASKRVRYLTTGNSFRETFIYNNYMYILATYIIEQLSGGKRFEDLISDAFFKPLSMESSSFLNRDMDRSDFVYPVAKDKNGEYFDIDPKLFWNTLVGGGAGAITSSADDMAKYMNLLLKQTRVEGITEKMIKDTFTPSMLFPLRDLSKPTYNVSHQVTNYALGWFTGQYRGYRQMYHSGQLGTHLTRVWLFPDKNAGVFVFTNAPMNDKGFEIVQRAILYHVSDLLLDLNPWFDTREVCSSQTPWAKQTNGPPGGPPPETTDPVEISDLQRYTGVYSDKIFGDSHIELDSGHLRFKFGLYGNAKLTPVSETTFKGEHLGILSFLNGILPLMVTFELDKYNGIAKTLSFSVHPMAKAAGPFVRTKQTSVFF